MIPSNNSLLTTELEIVVEPSKNYRMIFDRNRIDKTVDGKEAMKQVIYKILNTERYQYVIYSWNYGIELMDLYGQNPDLVCPILEQRIKEALIQDDRINDVVNFEFFINKNSILVTFTAKTIFGEIDAERTVNI